MPRILEKAIDRIIRRKNLFFLIALYSIATIILVPEVGKSFFSAVPMSGADTYQAFGLVSEQARVLSDEGFFRGLSTIFSEKDPGIITVYAIFTNFFGNIYPAYNLLFILSFVLAGLGAYLLTYRFTNDPFGSFLAGLVYAFAPYHVYHATETHIGAMHLESLPFFVLFLFRFLDGYRISDFFGLIFFAIVVALCEHQLLAFSVPLALLAIAFHAIVEPKKTLWNPQPWIYAGIGTAILWGIILLFFSSYLSVATSEENFLDAGLSQAKRYSIAPLDIVVPHEAYRPDSGRRERVLDDFRQRFTFPVEQGEKGSSSFIGYLPLCLFCLFPIAFVVDLRRRGWEKARWPLFFILASILFYLLAMGPEIENGSEGARITQRLPYAFLYEHAPFFENIRTVGRFFVYALLGLSVTVGYVFSTIFAFPKRRLIAGFIGIPFALVILWELAPNPVQSFTFSPSGVYEWMKPADSGEKIIEIPGATDYTFVSYGMITRTLHDYGVIGGMSIARIIPKEFEWQKNTPVIQDLLYGIPKGKDTEGETSIIRLDAPGIENEILAHFGVRYVIFNKEFFPEEERGERFEDFVRYMETHLSYVDRYEDDRALAYEIRPEPQENIFFAKYDYDDRWEQFKKEKSGEKRPYGKATPGAPLTAVNVSEDEKQVRIALDVKTDDYTIVSVLDARHKTLAEEPVMPDAWQTITFDMTLPPGETVFSFDFPTTALETIDISRVREIRE